MIELYSPKAGTIIVAGRSHRMRRGVHPVPEDVANSHEANVYGLKPTSEMTDAEWKALGLTRPVPKPVVAAKTE